MSDEVGPPLWRALLLAVRAAQRASRTQRATYLRYISSAPDVVSARARLEEVQEAFSPEEARAIIDMLNRRSRLRQISMRLVWKRALQLERRAKARALRESLQLVNGC